MAAISSFTSAAKKYKLDRLSDFACLVNCVAHMTELNRDSSLFKDLESRIRALRLELSLANYSIDLIFAAR